MEKYEILSIILPIFILLHILEEFVFPGGFMTWDRAYRPEIAKGINPRFLIIVNALLLLICINPITLGFTSGGIKWWLSIVSILFVNSYFHIKGVFVMKRYSPGVITSIVLYIPLTIYGYLYLISTSKVSWISVILCFSVGIAYHLFSSYGPLRKIRNINK
jgi:hypothetical protein